MLINKKSLLIIISCTIVLLLTILIAVLIPQCILRAGGTVNQKQISVVDGINATEKIVIPVKMNNGYSSPKNQVFNSTLPIEKLCELAVQYDDSVKYKINGKNAYLYREKYGKIVARAVLHNNSNNGYLNYTFENMNINGIIFPTHLTEKYINDSIILNEKIYNWYAISFISIDNLFNWLESIGIYTLVMNAEKNTIICRENGKQFENEIFFSGNLICIKQI